MGPESQPEQTKASIKITEEQDKKLEHFIRSPLSSANRLMKELYNDDHFYETATYAWVGEDDAKSYEKISGRNTLLFVKEAERKARFTFSMLQSDHGPEFGDWLVEQVKRDHRYTRIGKPNDNAHIERFNRTVQEECLDKVERTVGSLNRVLKAYLQYYNHERLHMAISLKTPEELLTEMRPSY